MKPAPDEDTAARRLALAEAGAGMLASAVGVAFGIHGFTTERRWLLLLVSTIAFGFSTAVMLGAYHWRELTDSGRTRTRRAGHAIGIVIGAAILYTVGDFPFEALSPGKGRRSRRGMRIYTTAAAFIMATCLAALFGLIAESWTHNDVVVGIAIPLGMFFGAFSGYRSLRLLYGDKWNQAKS